MKIAIVSANYTGSLDAFRTGFLEQLKGMRMDILFVEANTYVHDLNGRRLKSHGDKQLLEEIKRFKPYGVIFINACGRVPLIQDYLGKNKIASISWFWDHPAFLSLKLLEPSLYHEYVVANDTFKTWLDNHFKDNNIIVHAVPFPMLSHPQQREEKLTVDKYLKRNNHILFMGTYWEDSFDDIINNALIASGHDYSEKPALLAILANLIRSLNLGESNSKGAFHSAINYIMRHCGDTAVFINLINNYLSSVERKEIITVLSKSKYNLELYGSPAKHWQKLIRDNNLEGTRFVYKEKYISSYSELINICEGANVGLNIFHKQNQGGGTNFRINDYLLARTPILSNRNTFCEKVFKNEESAFYFNDKNDLFNTCDKILKNPDLAVNCVNNAYEIGMGLFSMNQVVNDLLRLLSLKQIPQSNTKEGLINYHRREEAIKICKNKACKNAEATIIGSCVASNNSRIEIKMRRLFRFSVKVPISCYYHDGSNEKSFCSKINLSRGYTKVSVHLVEEGKRKLLAKKHFIILK